MNNNMTKCRWAGILCHCKMLLNYTVCDTHTQNFEPVSNEFNIIFSTISLTKCKYSFSSKVHYAKVLQDVFMTG